MTMLLLLASLEWEPNICEQIFSRCPMMCHVHSDMVHVECSEDDDDSASSKEST